MDTGSVHDGMGEQVGTNANGSGTSDGDKSSGPVDAVRLAIPLGVGLIVGVLAAIGIEGDALERLIRNAHNAVAWILIVAVIGVGVPAAVAAAISVANTKAWKETGSRGRGVTMASLIIGSTALLVASLLALWIGTDGIYEREHPSLSMTVSGEEGQLTLAVDAVAPTLSSYEKMLLRVVALMDETVDPEGACRSPLLTSSNQVELLAWLETGPDRNGSARDSTHITVPDDAEAVCAQAALLDRNEDEPRDDRIIWGILNRSSFPATGASANDTLAGDQ